MLIFNSFSYSNFVPKMCRFSDSWIQKCDWNLGPRSLKVIETGTIQKIAYGFLLVFYRKIAHKNKTPFLRYSPYKYTATLKPGLVI